MGYINNNNNNNNTNYYYYYYQNRNYHYHHFEIILYNNVQRHLSRETSFSQTLTSH